MITVSHSFLIGSLVIIPLGNQSFRTVILPLGIHSAYPALTLDIANGKEERDETGTSWWNAAEIDEIVARIQFLLENWPYVEWGPFSPNDICVVSYYREQIQRLRARFRKEGASRPQFKKIKVESVMNIQGKGICNAQADELFLADWRGASDACARERRRTRRVRLE